jgi:hypothetical protein
LRLFFTPSHAQRGGNLGDDAADGIAAHGERNEGVPALEADRFSKRIYMMSPSGSPDEMSGMTDYMSRFSDHVK